MRVSFGPRLNDRDGSIVANFAAIFSGIGREITNIQRGEPGDKLCQKLRVSVSDLVKSYPISLLDPSVPRFSMSKCKFASAFRVSTSEMIFTRSDVIVPMFCI